MAYNPESARAANRLILQGYQPEEALRQVGVRERDFDDYTINTLGSPATNPEFGLFTNTGFRRVDQRELNTTNTPTAGYERDPVTGALRIDIFGVAPNTPNDDPVATPPQVTPDQRVFTQGPVPLPSDTGAQFAIDDPVSTVRGGITGPVDGISPYGEQDDAFDFRLRREAEPLRIEITTTNRPELDDDGNATAGGIRGPVPGISPYGEEDDPVDITDVNPGPESVPARDTTGYGTRYQLDDEPDNVRLNTGIETDPFGGLFGSTVAQVRSQAAVQAQTRQVNQRDWRVKLSLAPGADYLYKSSVSGDLLWPLRATDGVLFPYTPQIQVNYQTNYTKTPLTHSNYQGLFYQSSLVSSVSITAEFTAQDTSEANYLLAALHFFRSAGKMFYGQDSFAGAPPPLLYLSGFGEYQFMEHTLLLESFNYTLPKDVDYIRARSVNVNDTSLLRRRDLNQTNSAYDGLDGALGRLGTLVDITRRLLKIGPGANPGQPQSKGDIAFELGGNNPTYVPTKIEFYLTLIPVQTRDQISRQFSLREFGRGTLLRKGFW
jgi:hypothetical protein